MSCGPVLTVRARVAIDRGIYTVYQPLVLKPKSPLGLRLADKRSLPCPKRNEWLAARDELYEEIMHKAWNPELQVFGQSYEETDVLDSSVLIMPLVFFMTPVSVQACLFDADLYTASSPISPTRDS